MLLTMKPFGLEHFEALESIQSAYLTGEKFTYMDLIKAALICSRPSKRIGTFGGFFGRLRIRYWLRRCRRLDWKAESVKLRAFILAGLRELRREILAAKVGVK
jgi:hypothetical protein